MPVDLEVDTDLLRQAAAVLDDAAAIATGSAPVVIAYPLTDTSLGNSAVAREVVGAAGRRVAQAIEAIALLAAMAADGAGKLRSAAIAFDNAEAAGPAQPR